MGDGKRSYFIVDDYGTSFRRNRVHIKPDTTRRDMKEDLLGDEDYDDGNADGHTESVSVVRVVR